MLIICIKQKLNHKNETNKKKRQNENTILLFNLNYIFVNCYCQKDKSPFVR